MPKGPAIMGSELFLRRRGCDAICDAGFIWKLLRADAGNDGMGQLAGEHHQDSCGSRRPPVVYRDAGRYLPELFDDLCVGLLSRVALVGDGRLACLVFDAGDHGTCRVHLRGAFEDAKRRL